MKTLTLIPVLPGRLDGRATQLVDARRLHAFLGVGRDFSNWIKGRIIEYGFDENIDYLVAHSGEHVGLEPTGDFSPNPAKSRGRPNIDYFLTLDMAKELAMVERTPRGRQARRYFIACERQLQQLRQGLTAPPAVAVRLTRAERQAINRQAWAEAAGEIHSSFHARREALLRQYAEARAIDETVPSLDHRPSWAR